MEKDLRDKFLASLLRRRPQCPYCHGVFPVTEPTTLPRDVTNHLEVTVKCLSCGRRWIVRYAVIDTQLVEKKEPE
jgi:RNase P subunit RPR2